MMMLRLMQKDDAMEVARFYHDIRQDTVPLIHSPEQVAEWLIHTRIARGSSSVLISEDQIIGWVDVTENDLDQLYLRRGFTGQGHGLFLLNHAKSISPRGLELFTFQVNSGARRFYQREGFTEVYWGDGTGNEEGEPDVKLVWHP